MSRRVGARSAIVLGSLLYSIVMLLPTFTGALPAWWGGILPNQPVRLGLDLQGGMHLVLEVQGDKAVEFTLERMAEELKRELLKNRIPFGRIESVAEGGIRVALPERADVAKVRDVVAETFPALEVTSAAEGLLRLRLTDDEVSRIREFAIEQSLETVRNRVDQLGLSEPIIQRSGMDGILVQLPGETDPNRAKEIIGKTAVLEFHLLPEGESLASVWDGEDPCGVPEPDRSRLLDQANRRIRAGFEVLCGRDSDPVGGTSVTRGYLVESSTLMTGEVITDARPRPDTNVPGNYLVEIAFNGRGASLFETITAKNVNRQLAIVLDDTVYSAPRIQDRIGGGRAVITGSFTLREARDLAIVLRAGALPAPVEIAEERTVGPSLGRDSIRQGSTSFVVGAILVIFAMAIYYRGAGLVADGALVLNVLLVLAVLVSFDATLTLPGIAGIVLTLGMAVDANVLICERVREEIRSGQATRAAIEAGYARALPAILDSNATTFLSGLILFQFGSGPIRGFAVTLCIGIVTTVFTAVFATRTFYDAALGRRESPGLSI